MRREVPTWLAGLIILVVLIVIGLVYWIFVPKPQPGVGGEPITKTAPPPGVPGVGGPMQPSMPEKGK
ncbi:hypothetical protein Q2T83_10375 [Fervidibacter sacchari]|uniref:Membrane protein n=1 Tax=Candidatus Fervidibacter sacchari TaxID=1448929 RepID=A0ABT2EQV3_9BACT|nr:hypothetical protein [Candidatus Fervidibacter sacchari]MCS3920297.1 putative membrane protein [Candidatus Fervidibacter sacchari]WKU14740.1 hypothetical protein Q2T83_10375 [Candidatus Fervidibacter sacchari]